METRVKRCQMAENNAVIKKEAMQLPVTEQIERFKEFFEESQKRAMLEIVSTGRISINIDFAKISAFDTKLAVDMLDYPEEVIKAAELSIKELELPTEAKNFKVRVYNLPESQKLTIREIRSGHIGKLLAVDGIVRRKSDVRPQVTKTGFECPNCGRIISILQTEATFREPRSCSCGRKGNFRLLEKDLVDAQSMVLEENPEMLEGGDQPKRIGVFLKDDLVSPISEKKTNPGNRVRIVGILKEVPVVKHGSRSTSYDLLIDTNHFETIDEDFYDIKIMKDDEEAIKSLSKDKAVYDKLIASIAPSIYGYEKVKEALLLQLMGGVQKKRSDGVVSRGDMHVLLVGDPGSGKSQLLKRISIIAPKGRYVSGGGVSGAGITAAVVKDEILGGWSLEAGALVLANNGVCCTTEDTKFIREDGQVQTFKELFEQQTESVIHPAFKILGLDTATLKIKPFSIRKAFRIKNRERLFEVTTRSGRKINLTESNKILISENSEFRWRPIGGVRVGSYMAVPKHLPIAAEDNHSPGFAYICGLIFSDGHIELNKRNAKTSFYNTEPILIGLFKRKMEEMGHSFSVHIQKSGRKSAIRSRAFYSKRDCCRVYNSRKEFAKTVNEFGIPVGNKSSCAPLSNKLLTYSDRTLANFLKGVFDGDGYIRVRDPTQVVLTTGVYETAVVFQTCLSRLGIISSVKKSTNSWHCEITGIRNCQDFFRKIGTNHPKKLARFYVLASEQEKDRTDILPNHQSFFQSVNSDDGKSSHDLWHYRNFNAAPSRQRLLLLNAHIGNHYLSTYLQGNVFWDKIVDIREGNADYVYDFTMEGTNNFVANNIIMHNCIDEMDKMSEEDTGAMHEALEQQCYHHDTEIMFADGRTEKMGEFVERLMEAHREKVIEGNNCEILALPSLPYVLTTDFSTISPVKIARVSRHKAPETFFKITYSNGRAITITPEHPVYYAKDDAIATCKAEEVKEGLLAPAPSRLPISPVGKEEPLERQYGLFLGLQCSEGYSYKNNKRRYAEFGISNTNSAISSLARDAMKAVFGKEPQRHIREAGAAPKAKLEIVTMLISSKEAYQRLRQEVPEIMQKAINKRVPNKVKTGSYTLKIAFLQGFFLGDGYVDQKRTGFTTSSHLLAQDIQQLLLELEIYSYIETEQRKSSAYYKIIVSGSESCKNFYALVPNIDKKKTRIAHLLERSNLKKNDRNILPHSYVAILNSLLKEFRLSDGCFHGILEKEQNAHRQTCWHYLKILEERFQKALDSLQCGNAKQIRKLWCISRSELAQALSVSYGGIWNLEKHTHKRHDELLSVVKKLAEKKSGILFPHIKNLHRAVTGDIRFLRITKVERIQNTGHRWAYDVTIEPTHSFVSQNLVLHNSVSIAKANIQATLMSRTTVLAAANPKYGRFDPYGNIAEQINLPPALINRFDLIFTIKDSPQVEKDEKTAKHILQLHQTPDIYEPDIPTQLLKKYISYARQKVRPVLSDEAIDEIKAFYVQLRNREVSDERAARTIPITARQLEALVRMSEASAKIRLSDKVTREDARRAIELLVFCLMQVGREKETGQIDIDRIATGIPTSQREKVFKVKRILEELEEGLGKTIPVEDVARLAVESGISKAEVDEIIEKLKKTGDVYEPRYGFLSRM